MLVCDFYFVCLTVKKNEFEQRQSIVKRDSRDRRDSRDSGIVYFYKFLFL